MSGGATEWRRWIVVVGETLVATAGGAVSVTIGVVVGAVLARRTQDRHWLRDKQLAAYEELLRQYATFAVVLRWSSRVPVDEGRLR